MPAQTDEAIVLRLSDFSETSQVVSLMTAGFGQARLLAKGAKRSTKARASVGLDLLEYGQVTFVPPREGAGLGALVEWRQLDAFLGVRGQLLTMYAGLYAAELTAATVQEYDAHPELFTALLELMRTLSGLSADSPHASGLAPLVQFQAALLKSIGYAPNLRQCVSCGKARSRGAAAWFSSHAGGLLCAACHPRHAEKHPIEANLLDGARGTTDPRAWFGLLDYHLSHIAGRAFEGARALRGHLAGAAPAL